MRHKVICKDNTRRQSAAAKFATCIVAALNITQRTCRLKFSQRCLHISTASWRGDDVQRQG